MPLLVKPHCAFRCGEPNVDKSRCWFCKIDSRISSVTLSSADMALGALASVQMYNKEKKKKKRRYVKDDKHQ